MKKEKLKELLDTLKTKEAWKVISKEMKLFPETIERLSNNLDWDLLSENPHVRWTEEFLSEYKDRINWTKLSGYLFDEWTDYSSKKEEKQNQENQLDIVREFSELLDWKVLSASSLPTDEEYLDEFEEYWHWDIIAENDDIDWTPELFSKYEEELLPFLEDMLLENVASANSSSNLGHSRKRHNYYNSKYIGLWKQQIENEIDKLKLDILQNHSSQDKYYQSAISKQEKIEDIINKYF